MKKDEKVQKKDVHHTHTVNPIELKQLSSVELKRNAKGEIIPPRSKGNSNFLFSVFIREIKFKSHDRLLPFWITNSFSSEIIALFLSSPSDNK